MKTLLVSAVLLIHSSITHAQTRNEWFKQKETQKKYLLQQIAALKIYLGYIEKGYDIANKGLQTIHSIKKGDFTLHNGFFTSLKEVNPAIKNWSRVTDIILIQVKIVKQAKEVLSSIKQDREFAPDEIDYCKRVFDNLLDECLKDIDELFSVTTSGELQMKDDERIQKIENIYLDVQDKYLFSSSFGDEMKLLSLQRMNEEKETEVSKVLSK
jgi:hypothetical protein